MNIFSLTGKDEFILLSKYNIFPLKYRLFFNFCTFLFNLCKNNNIFFLNNFKTNSISTRNKYLGNSFKTNYGKYSFTTISTKILNEFLAVHIELGSQNFFKNYLRMNTNLFDLFNSSIRFWTD